MLERFKEPELLAYVEGELSDAKRRSIEKRLARDPEVRALVDALRVDREQLQAVEEPTLPMDFVTALEPQLARAMLIDDTPGMPGMATATPGRYEPGAYRRKHQRRHRREHRRHRLNRFAVAAVVLVALSAALWATISLGPFGRSDGERVADNTPPPANGQARSTPSDPSAASSPGPGPDAPLTNEQVVHHRIPLPAPARLASAASEASFEPISVETGFALVIHADDPAAAEQIMRRVLGELVAEASVTRASAPDSVALVRNFTHDEARRLFRQWSSGTDSPTAPVVMGTDLTPETVELEMPRWRDKLEREREITSEHLLGPRDIAPDFEHQLDLSARGATHTVVVPEARLAEFLSRLRLAEQQETFLRALPVHGAVEGPADADDVPADDATLRRWVKDFQLVRDFIARLDEATGREHGETSVVLPVVIETR